jgi:hypothetical protein
MLAKVDVLLFWEKYRPRAPVVDKINAVTLLEKLPWASWPIFTTHTTPN